MGRGKLQQNPMRTRKSGRSAGKGKKRGENFGGIRKPTKKKREPQRESLHPKKKG